jgi:hypothetical protein
MQILSPPWDREKRKADFPAGFHSLDVPALKLEADGRLVFATQNPEMISELLVNMKGMLMSSLTNLEIHSRLSDIVLNWKDGRGKTTCIVTST